MATLLNRANPEDSPLIWAIRHEDTEMPAEGPKLQDSVIKDFEAWIAIKTPNRETSRPARSRQCGLLGNLAENAANGGPFNHSSRSPSDRRG